MNPLRVYADTSVFGGVGDDEFASLSRAFFDRVAGGEVTVLVSQITYNELAAAPSCVRRVLERLEPGQVEEVPAGQEVRALADAYAAHGALGGGARDDALHVAAATVAGADAIVSWNFRHIVNLDRIRKFNGVNALMGYRPVEIRSPLELLHDNEN